MVSGAGVTSEHRASIRSCSLMGGKTGSSPSSATGFTAFEGGGSFCHPHGPWLPHLLKSGCLTGLLSRSCVASLKWGQACDRSQGNELLHCSWGSGVAQGHRADPKAGRAHMQLRGGKSVCSGGRQGRFLFGLARGQGPAD